MGAVEIRNDWYCQVVAGDCRSNSPNDADQCKTVQGCMQLLPLRSAILKNLVESLYAARGWH